MPLFSRPDGSPVPKLALVWRMIPYLMRTRTESSATYEQTLDLSATLPFIERWNQAHDRRISVFHLLVIAAGIALRMRPGLNRFVSGRTLYARKGVQIAFSAKRELSDAGELVTAKVAMPDEPFAAAVERLHAIVDDGRSNRARPVDRELVWLFRLPSFLLGLVVRAGRLLDRFNLYPKAMIETDPLFASLFVANVGSVGLDGVTHPLWEWGTCSLFCVIGRVRQEGNRDVVTLRYTFDTRINDGFYCARSLEIIRELIEDPSGRLV